MNPAKLLEGFRGIERYVFFSLMAGVVMVGAGTAATVLSTKGIPAALTLIGSFITFVSTVILVFYWFFKGDK